MFECLYFITGDSITNPLDPNVCGVKHDRIVTQCGHTIQVDHEITDREVNSLTTRCQFCDKPVSYIIHGVLEGDPITSLDF